MWSLRDSIRAVHVDQLQASAATGAAWAFEQAMGLVWYYEKSNPGMAQLGRRTLARIQEDSDLFV